MMTASMKYVMYCAYWTDRADTITEWKVYRKVSRAILGAILIQRVV